MGYAFGTVSKKRMEGVHPLLVECAERAISYGIIDITVLPNGGLRTKDMQKQLVDKGASQTMNSKHRAQDDGYGHAIDLSPYPVDWNNIERFVMVGTLMFKASAQTGLVLEWGGHWKSFKDYPHFQIKEILC